MYRKGAKLDVYARNDFLIAHYRGPFLFRTPPSEVTERISAKLCHSFGSRPDLKMCVQNFEVARPETCGSKTVYFRISTELRRHLHSDLVYLGAFVTV